jgi:two-component system chemotaxis response regulator CheY
MGKAVLLVDDSRAMRDYITSILEDDDAHEITEAANGFDALRVLPRSDFGLIITDVNMPDINGIELTRFVRQTPRHRKTPILVISTEGAMVDLERAMAAGATAFLVKPFTREQLLSAVVDAAAKAANGGTP